MRQPLSAKRFVKRINCTGFLHATLNNEPGVLTIWTVKDGKAQELICTRRFETIPEIKAFIKEKVQEKESRTHESN